MTSDRFLLNRRAFAGQLAAAGALASPLGAAWAQAGLQEGRDFVRVASPVPVAGNKVEVVEFFGYWCPHCNAFEPELEPWVQKLPADKVVFRRVPVAFQGWHENYQRLYYAVEALGLVEKLHRKVFAAIHVDHKRFDKDADVLAFANANGVDGAKLVEAMKGFSMGGKLAKANQLAGAYRIDGVPTLGIHGRWMTSPSIAGGGARALAAANGLIQQVKLA